MSKMVFVLAFILLTSATVCAKGKAEDPVIKILNRHLEDAGCVYFNRKSDTDAFPIFLSSSDGTWMNIDGKERQLIQDDQYVSSNSTKYTTDDYQIYLYYGRGKQLEGGVNYGKARITVQHQGYRTIIKAKGGCGC